MQKLTTKSTPCNHKLPHRHVGRATVEWPFWSGPMMNKSCGIGRYRTTFPSTLKAFMIGGYGRESFM